MANELRKTILEAEDIQEEVVPVPEWGVDVLVKSMTGLERARFLRRTSSDDGQVQFERFYPELIIATAHDPADGEKLFTASDRDALNAKSSAAIEKVASVAQRLSGLGSQDIETAKKDSEQEESSGST